MKIITNNAVYVQKTDMEYLLDKTHPAQTIPASVCTEIFSRGEIVIDNSNRYEFVALNTPEAIEFFKEIDWIIDYNEVKDLSEEETIQLVQSISKEQNGIVHKIMSMTKEEIIENMNMWSQAALLEYKINTLQDVLKVKRGTLKMNLPEGIDFSSETGHEKGIKKRIKTIFNKK